MALTAHRAARADVVPPERGEALPLPYLLVVADSAATAGRPLGMVVSQAVAGGARAVWLRDKEKSPGVRRRSAEELAEIVHAVGGLLIASPGPGSEVADGTQLGAGSPLSGRARRAEPRRGPATAGLVGRSCHGPAELASAASEGCRWATLSPIFATASKPGYGPPLGVGALAGTPLPVWALGGVDGHNAAECLRAGAAGVAVMGAVMKAADPAAAVAAILSQLDGVARCPR